MADQVRFMRRLTGGGLLLGGALVLAACGSGGGGQSVAASHHTSTHHAPIQGHIGSVTTTTTTTPAAPAPGTAQTAPTPKIGSLTISSATPTPTPRTTAATAPPTTTPPVPTTTPAPTPTTTPSAPADSIVINAASTPNHGMVLTNSMGITLYLLTADSPTSSACTTIPCTVIWPPVKATGGGVAGPGIQQSLLGKLRLSDGTEQVTYAGHPLYTYIGDGKPGDVTGEGIKSFGGTWYALSAGTGKAV